MLGVTANGNLTFFQLRCISCIYKIKHLDDTKHREVFHLHLPAIHYVLSTWLLTEHVFNYHFTLPRRIHDKKIRVKSWIRTSFPMSTRCTMNGSRRKTLQKCLRSVILWVRGWQLLGHMMIESWTCWISRPKLRWSMRIRLSLDFRTRPIWRHDHCSRFGLWLRN